MDEFVLAARLKNFDPRLQRIYRDAKAITLDTADTLDDNFQLSAMIIRAFRRYLARKGSQDVHRKRTTM